MFFCSIKIEGIIITLRGLEAAALALQLDTSFLDRTWAEIQYAHHPI
jgi:hypothetical protein